MLKQNLYFTFKFQNVHLTRIEIVKFKLLKVSEAKLSADGPKYRPKVSATRF
jgi:hypothetical protein